MLTDWETGCIDAFLPHAHQAYKAVKGQDPDAPTFSQAMQSAQVEYWIEAIKLELAELERRETWTELHRSALPEGANLVPGTWAFKIKHFPDG